MVPLVPRVPQPLLARQRQMSVVVPIESMEALWLAPHRETLLWALTICQSPGPPGFVPTLR